MTVTDGERTQEVSFRIAMILKGLDGLIELAIGLVLWLAPGVIQAIFSALANNHMHNEATHHFVSYWAGRYSHELSHGAHALVILFLISHGVIKLALVYCLLRNYMWVYRPAIAVLGLFAIVQLVVVVDAPSIAKVLLLLLDVVIVWLVWREWRASQTAVRRDAQ